MKILAIIPARGGSKSIPKKNIINFKGKPLIAWTIEASLKSKYIDKTVVSSDCDEILNISKKYGANILKRPNYLSQDDTRTEPVLIDVIEKIKEEYDCIVLLQATSPLRDVSHIDEAIEKFMESKKKSLISVFEPEHSPLKSFVVNENGSLQGIVNNQYPFMPRQSLPKVFYPNGAIYICNCKEFIDKKELFFENSTTYYQMPISTSLDIDSYSDLQS